MSENIKNLIFITGAASHTSDVDPTENMDYQNYIESVNTPYLLYQLTFVVCDLFVWYDNYLNSNSDIEANKSYWVDLEEKQFPLGENDWTEGVVIRIAENGWGTFKPDNSFTTLSIQPNVVTSENIIENCRLKVRTEPSPDKTKTFIKEIIKL